MKKIALTLIVLFTVVLHISAQNDSIPHTEAQQKAAIKLATDWISMFYQVKDADPLMKITKTPFLLDGKEIVHSNEKLVEMYNTIIEDKSSQEFPEIKAEIFDNTKYVAKAEFTVSLLFFCSTRRK